MISRSLPLSVCLRKIRSLSASQAPLFSSSHALCLEHNSLRQVRIGGVDPAMTEQRVEFVDLIFPHGNSHALIIMRSPRGVEISSRTYLLVSIEQSKEYTSYKKTIAWHSAFRRRSGEASFPTIFPLSHTSFECSTQRYLWMHTYFLAVDVQHNPWRGSCSNLFT